MVRTGFFDYGWLFAMSRRRFGRWHAASVNVREQGCPPSFRRQAALRRAMAGPMPRPNRFRDERRFRRWLRAR